MVEKAGPVISTGGSGLPSRIIFYGSEKIGKSSWAAHAPNPIFAMAKGETGLLSLIDGGIVPPTPHFDEVMTWTSMLANIKWLMTGDHNFRTLVIDTANQTQGLLFDHCTRTRYEGDRAKFNAYGKGVNDVAMPEFGRFLDLLDQVRSTKKMAMVLLAHARVKPFSNPEGDNYSEYQVDMDDKIYGLAAKWADIIAFGKHDIVAMKAVGDLKAKARGTGQRTMHTVGSASWKAGNRYGLPPEISMGRSPREAWNNFYNALKLARSNGAQPAPSAVVDAPESTDNPIITVSGDGEILETTKENDSE